MTPDPVKIKSTLKVPLAQAIGELAECFEWRGDEKDSVVSHARRAHNLISAFLGDAEPSPLLTEDEAELSSTLYTYLRKYEDTKLSVILYRMISENRGKAVWIAFVKALVEHKKSKLRIREAISSAAMAADNMPTDFTIMECALCIWNEQGGIKQALAWVAEIEAEEAK